jgi:putative (di)nucleoside polyphosphate hydrolase
MIVDDDIFDDTRYRANVGIMVVNSEHKIMAGEAFHYPGEWMMPQGGIDALETPEQAMKRELVEETTLEFSQTRLLKKHSQWVAYQLGKPLEKDGKVYVGQRQKWFLLEYLGALPDANQARDREFSRFDWVEIDWLISKAAKFKKSLYRKVITDFQPYFP